MTRNISAGCLDRFLFFWLGWSEGTLPISSAFQDRQSANNRIAVGWHGLMPGGHETEKTSIEDQVLKSNPILEAFGNVQVLGLDLWPQKNVTRNSQPFAQHIQRLAFAPFFEAKTIRNDNSSRFGKFIDIEQLSWNHFDSVTWHLFFVATLP